MRAKWKISKHVCCTNHFRPPIAEGEAFGRAVLERGPRGAFYLLFFSLSLSLSLFLFLSLSLSLVVALFLTDLTLSLSLSSRGLSPFDIFVSLRTRELTEEEAPKSKSLRARKPSRNRRTSNNRCRRWRTRKLSRPSSWVGAPVPVCTR